MTSPHEPSHASQNVELRELGPDGLEPLVKEIQALGYDRDTAGNYALQIGDTPCIDADGKTIVVDEQTGQQIALDLHYY